ncbi:MAG: LLM class flavin-dependent oxidoreductase [Alphaproteobacteria bacterium]|nr:LLM class flavin-dependent oxidoreductase [Alphaproteobacteria bacterium]
MEFGIFNLMNRRDRSQTPAQIIAQTVEQVQAAESAGFGAAWFAEHHFTNYSITPSPLLMVAHVAPQTLRIKLGTAVVLPALYEPARLLGEIAFVDNLAEGRLILGLGSGYQAYELERFGVSLDEARAVTDEWVDLISQGVGSESVEFHGKYIDLPKTYFTNAPIQLPRPPIWIAGNSPDSQARAARGPYPLIVTGFGQSNDTLVRIRTQTEETWQAKGRSLSDLHFGSIRYCFVTDDKDAALAYAENARYQIRLSTYLRQGQTELPAAWLPEESFEGEMSPEDILAWNPIGDPETVAARIADEITRVGSNHIAYYMTIGNTDHEAAMTSIRRFGDEVMPLIEKEVGPLGGVNIPKPLEAAQ